jgi:hypothetical protein
MSLTDRQRAAYDSLTEAIIETSKADDEANEDEQVGIDGYVLGDHVTVASFIKYDEDGEMETETVIIGQLAHTPAYRIVGLLQSGLRLGGY